MAVHRALTALLLVLSSGALMAEPAWAQGNRGGYGYDYDDDDEPPRRRRGGRWDDDGPRGYPPRGYERNRPPGPNYGRMGGSVCVTSRGSCPTGLMLPRNAPCACDIPGFGKKRGAIGY